MFFNENKEYKNRHFCGRHSAIGKKDSDDGNNILWWKTMKIVQDIVQES